MARTYKIGEMTNRSQGLVSYFVTDANDSEEVSRRPKVAEFPVGQRWDKDAQHRHAEIFRDYMNQVQAAQEKAYQQTQLIDILKKDQP